MRKVTFVIAACLSPALIAGCGGAQISVGTRSDDLPATRLTSAVGVIQTRPQTLPPVLVERDNTILVDASVTIIDDPAQDIVVAELPDRTILGFENDTGFDIYIRYFADRQRQAVYVYDRETLLLEYPCLAVVELTSEDDVDPDTGLLVDSFNLVGVDFFNPDDFVCGDAFILNIDPFSVSARAEVVDLLP